MENMNQRPGEGDINKKENLWKIDPEKTIEIYEKMPEALKNKDLDQVKEILSDPQGLRGVFLDREGKNKNLIQVRNGFEMLFKESFGESADIYSVDGEKIVEWIHDLDLPETVLNEMMTIAFHLNDHKRFFRIFNIILEAEDGLQNESVKTKALHDLASWEDTVEKNPEKAIDINKQVVGHAKERKDIVLETKARFGLTTQKDLKPKMKAEDFEQYVDRFKEQANEYDSIRSMEEAARAYFNLALNQKNVSKGHYFNSLDKAESLAQNAAEEAHNFKQTNKIQFSNALYLAKDIMSQIYREKKEFERADELKREANKLKREIGYRH
ncbi:MAG: hypothetical protein R6V40_03470 [Candidatus Moraniibacteriota bacterium]